MPAQLFYLEEEGAIEIVLTENIANFHKMCTTKDKKSLQWMIKAIQNMISSHLLSIRDISEEINMSVK